MKIMVLNDGETYSGLHGCAIYEVPDGLEIEEIEELLSDEGDDLRLVERFDDESSKRVVFGELDLQPFGKDADANWPDDTLYLYEVAHGAMFKDAKGVEYSVIGHGPVQGSVHIERYDDAVNAYYDVTTRVRPYEPDLTTEVQS